MDSNIFNWILISIAILILIIIGYKILNYRDYYSSIEKINYELFKKFTILDILSYISREYPDKPAMKIKNKKNWKTVSYSSYHDNVVKFAESINSWLGDEIRVAILEEPTSIPQITLSLAINYFLGANFTMGLSNLKSINSSSFKSIFGNFFIKNHSSSLSLPSTLSLFTNPINNSLSIVFLKTRHK